MSNDAIGTPSPSKLYVNLPSPSVTTVAVLIEGALSLESYFSTVMF